MNQTEIVYKAPNFKQSNKGISEQRPFHVKLKKTPNQWVNPTDQPRPDCEQQEAVAFLSTGLHVRQWFRARACG